MAINYNSAMTGPAFADLGLGGDTLQGKVTDETEEQKRRRLMLEQLRQSLGPLGMAGAGGA